MKVFNQIEQKKAIEIENKSNKNILKEEKNIKAKNDINKKEESDITISHIMIYI